MQGVVRTVVEWGAFVALPEAENLEGLVHASEASHDARVPLQQTAQRGPRADRFRQREHLGFRRHGPSRRWFATPSKNVWITSPSSAA